MRVLNLSGGATKISGLFGVSEALMMDKGWKPDIISGVSSGALLAVPLAMGLYDEIRDQVLEFDLKDIFDSSPVTKTGRLTAKAIARVLTGKLSFGTQNNLTRTLSGLISRDRFEGYKKDKSRPECYIMAVDYNNGSKVKFKVRDLSYEDYLQAVKASCSIPVYVEPVVMKGRILYDGGVKDHIMTGEILDNIEDISEVISVYSRPKEASPRQPLNLRNVVDVLKRTLEIMTLEVSLADEAIESWMCAAKNIERKAYYLPRIMDGDYDADKQKLRRLYLEGREQVLNNYKKDGKQIG